jgi:anti-sigma B factor antagonist
MVDANPGDNAESCEISTSYVGRVAVVAVSGTVDTLTAPRLAAALDAALADSPTALIVDLSQVVFLASAGMGVLLVAHDKAARSSAGFGVVAATPVTIRPMTIVGIHQVFSLYETLDDALRGVGEA